MRLKCVTEGKVLHFETQKHRFSQAQSMHVILLPYRFGLPDWWTFGQVAQCHWHWQHYKVSEKPASQYQLHTALSVFSLAVEPIISGFTTGSW